MTNSGIQDDLASVQRHGYAAYADSLFVGWALTKKAAGSIPGATHVVNVQNGAVDYA